MGDEPIRDETKTDTYIRAKAIESGQRGDVDQDKAWLANELIRTREALIVLGFMCDHCGPLCDKCQNIIRYGLGEKWR
jgi:hypothetical protein